MNEDADSTTTSPLSVTTRPPRPAIDSVEFYGEEDVEIHFTTPGIENWSGRSVVIEQSIDGGEFEAIGTDAWDSSDWDTAASVDWEDVEGTVVSYRVYVTGNGEGSDYSNVFTFVRQPHGPSSLHDVSSDTDSIELEWIDHSTHEEGFELVVTPADGSGPWTIILDANTTSYTVEGLDEATEYSFEAWSFANGERSQESSGSINAITKLAAPSGLSVTAPNAYETNLSWADVSHAEDGYIITYYKGTTAPTGPTESLGLYTAFAPVNATGFSIIGLNADTLYSFKVHAYRDIEDSSDPEETIRIESPIAGPATATTDEEPAAGTQYRFHFDGSPMVSDTIFTNTGTLTFNGPTAWTTGTPPNVTAGYVQSNVSGTIVSTRVGWQTENFSYPGSAFTTYADGTSHGVITMEDTTNRGGPIPPHDGEWHLERETRVIDGTRVSIEAVDDEGDEEDEDVLTFRVSRSGGSTAGSLVVNLHPGAGTAKGADYTGMPSSVTILANEEYVEFDVTPVDDGDYEEAETVVAILKASDTYWLTAALMAEGVIGDNDVSISVDSNNDGKINEADDLIEDATDRPGALIFINDDNDDEDDYPDFEQEGAVTDEDDLIRVKIDIPQGVSGTVSLTIPSGGSKVAFYTTKDRSAPLAETTWNAGEQPGEVWAEAIDASAGLADIVFALAFQLTGGGQPATDQAKATAIKAEIDPIGRTYDYTNKTYLPNSMSDIGPGASENSVINPAAIILMAPEAATTTTAAIIRINRVEGFSPALDENDDRVEWTITSHGGQAQFLNVGGTPDNTGRTTRVYGTQEGRVLLTAWYVDGALKRPLDTFEAYVTPLREIKYRVNLLKDAQGNGTATTPQQAEDHLKIANQLLRQVGVKLVPDANAIGTDGADPVQGRPGIFTHFDRPTAEVTDLIGTRIASDMQNTVKAISVNDRDRVLQITYVGVLKSKATETTPSTPIYGSTIGNPGSHRGNFDVVYRSDVSETAKRRTYIIQDETRRAAASPLVFGMVLGTLNGDPDLKKREYAETVAHEIGHILGFGHRDNSVPDTFPASTIPVRRSFLMDGLNKPIGKNVMATGQVYHGKRDDFDLPQVMAVQYAKIFDVLQGP